ncbi:MAG: histidine kinase [Ferruginibacter sp.]|nr:histidine kinase [Ferruginibacter sp.]
MPFHHHKKNLAILITVLCIAFTATAQYEEKNFTHYTVKDGLSDNLINCMQQDEQGYMWIGTDAGLNRFDGNSFRNFYRRTAPVHLPSIVIRRLKHFGTQRLGILSGSGLLVLDTKNYTVQPYIVPDSTAIGIHINSVWDAAEMSDKSFAVTSAAGFYRFNSKGELLYRHDAFKINDIGQKRILYGRDIFNLGSSKYAVYVNESGIALYDDDQKVFKELQPDDAGRNFFANSPFNLDGHWTVKQQLSKDEFIFLRAASNGIIYYNRSLKKQVTTTLPSHITDSLSWESKILMLNDSMLAINSGFSGFYILKIDRQSGVITSEGIKYLRNYEIRCLFLDKDKRLWIGTSEGLLKQELKTPVITAWQYRPPGGKKYSGGFSNVYRYKDKLYAGRFSYSKGLAIINPLSMKLIKEIDFFSDNTIWNEVRGIQMYHPDTLWISTSAGLLWFDTRSEHYGKILDEIKYPWAAGLNAFLAPTRSDGYAWMCASLGGKLIRYHIPSRTFTIFTRETTPALPFEKVKQVVYDAYGDVWVSGHSLARWNNRENRFDTLITTYGGEGKFNDDILTIRADDSGSLWLHNALNGLLEYRIKEKRFIAYSMKDGLPSDIIIAMSPVIQDELWAASNNHLYLFNIKTKHVTVYDYRDGLPEHRPTGRRIYLDEKTGLLYLCSDEFLVRFPCSPPAEKDHSSSLMIEEITANNERTWYNPGDAMQIPHNENYLFISFSVIDFDKSNYHFFYRLNKSDNWNPIGNQRNINLSNLAPGKYMLELKALGKPGVEKLKSFTFIIKAPFWKMAWFISLVAILLGSIIYYAYRRRIRYIRQRAEIDKQLSQSEMKALQAQMNPHFIFNSLNSIREMILNNENKDASHYLSKFAHLIRITLDQSSQPLVSLRNTADYLQRYMEMEQVRNSHLTYTITIDDKLNIDESFIPPMLIQPFIENGLWHGVSASNKNIYINVRFKKEDESLVCTIEDNGIGVSRSLKNKTINGRVHNPHGISNIQNRIKLLNEKHDLHCTVSIQDKKDIDENNSTGTLVTINLPLEIN